MAPMAALLLAALLALLPPSGAAAATLPDSYQALCRWAAAGARWGGRRRAVPAGTGRAGVSLGARAAPAPAGPGRPGKGQAGISGEAAACPRAGGRGWPVASGLGALRGTEGPGPGASLVQLRTHGKPAGGTGRLGLCETPVVGLV